MTEQSRPLNESGQESPDTLLYHGGAKAFAKMGEWATAYAANGWRIFPLHTLQSAGCSCGKPDCTKIGKHPRISNWQNAASCDPATVAGWWEQYPEANIGMSLDGLVVLDVDPRHGGFESLVALEQANTPLDHSTRQKSGSGGWHYVMQPGEQNVPIARGFKPGLDLLTRAGCYIVVAPSLHACGGRYEWTDEPHPLSVHRDSVVLAAPPQWLVNAATAPTSKTAPKAGFMLPDVISEGRRDQTLTSMAGAMRRVGASPDVILAALAQLNQQQCDPPLSNGDLERIVRSVARYQPKSALTTFPLTELGNAERFSTEHGENLRYCAAQKLWLVWNGRLWKPDATQAVKALAMKMVRRLYADASDVPDKTDRAALLKHANASQNDSRIKGLLSLTSAFQDIAVTIDVLDADPWLLNVANGTLDLRTGELREHKQEDLITKVCPVTYDPDVTHEVWDSYLRTVTGDNQEVMAFLQRAVGYSLTGDVSEEKLFFVHGPAASGKSTFMEAVRAMLGDYSRVADFETFLQRSFSGGPRNDVAHLAGARFVASVETDEGKRLAQGLVKMLTGGDTVTARFLYSNLFEFRPTFKLWLAANDAPQVNDDDEAMWRRILRVPFDRSIPEGKRDPESRTCSGQRGMQAPQSWHGRLRAVWRGKSTGWTCPLRSRMLPASTGILWTRCRLSSGNAACSPATPAPRQRRCTRNT